MPRTTTKRFIFTLPEYRRGPCKRQCATNLLNRRSFVAHKFLLRRDQRKSAGVDGGRTVLREEALDDHFSADEVFLPQPLPQQIARAGAFNFPSHYLAGLLVLDVHVDVRVRIRPSEL